MIKLEFVRLSLNGELILCHTLGSATTKRLIFPINGDGVKIVLNVDTNRA